jgi:hypothetical protein
VQASGERHPFVGGQPFGDEIGASPDTGHRLGRNYEGFRAAIDSQVRMRLTSTRRNTLRAARPRCSSRRSRTQSFIQRSSSANQPGSAIVQ